MHHHEAAVWKTRHFTVIRAQRRYAADAAGYRTSKLPSKCDLICLSMLEKGLRVVNGKAWLLEKVLGQSFENGKRECSNGRGAQMARYVVPEHDVERTADEAINAYVQSSAGASAPKRKKSK